MYIISLLINRKICRFVDRQKIDLISLERKERRDPPKFSEQLTDVTIFEGIYNNIFIYLLLNQFNQLGSTAKLRCEVKGKPTPKIEWLKNGEVKHYKNIYVTEK